MIFEILIGCRSKLSVGVNQIATTYLIKNSNIKIQNCLIMIEKRFQNTSVLDIFSQATVLHGGNKYAAHRSVSLVSLSLTKHMTVCDDDDPGYIARF